MPSHWLLNPAAIRVLIACGDNVTTSRVAKISDVTISHVTKLLQKAKAEGMIVFAKRDNRSYTIHLTSKGDDVKKHFDAIMARIRENGTSEPE